PMIVEKAVDKTVLIFNFVLYSFGGFLLEVAFARVTRNPKKDRKCFYLLPLCPVYGLGAVGILALPDAVLQHFWLLFFCGAMVATLTEYAVGFLDEKIMGVAFWDYSHLPLNVGGKVCLLFSGLWGILAVVLVRIVHPFVGAVTAQIPLFLALPLLVLVAGDGLRSAVLLRRTRSPRCLMWYCSQPTF
ncbi:MAG: putative ABC transporter permease, partial [Oscillospiraceae bacterium]